MLELIHSDVCGPVTPVGLLGSRFFVTFIDDWTHFTMVFLMASKSEVLSCFEQYEAIVTAKFNVKISRLRCDNQCCKSSEKRNLSPHSCLSMRSTLRFSNRSHTRFRVPLCYSQTCPSRSQLAPARKYSFVFLLCAGVSRNLRV